jgi:DNA-binding MarR family transcriptional regulator
MSTIAHRNKPQSVRKMGRSQSAKSAARPLPRTISRPDLLVGGSDVQFRRLVHNLFAFFARHDQIRSGHAKYIGLAGTEYTVLISIAHLSDRGAVNIKTVGSHLHVSGAFVTSVVRRLRERGLVDKRTDSGDRRRVSLTVTEAGYRLLEKLAPVQRQVNDVEFDCLGAGEFDELLVIVDRLIESSNRALSLQHYLLSNSESEQTR